MKREFRRLRGSRVTEGYLLGVGREVPISRESDLVGAGFKANWYVRPSLLDAVDQELSRLPEVHEKKFIHALCLQFTGI